jgi:hypothetical protein
MSYSKPNSPLFGNEQDFDTLHAITSDSNALADLGLSSFSILELKHWLEEPANAAIFGVNPGSYKPFLLSTNGSYSFTYWRKSGRNGKYVSIDEAIESTMSWSYGPYGASDLPFDDDLTPIGNIATFNDKVVAILRSDPDGIHWNENDKATMEFLCDIKSSKSSCVQWTTKLKINGAEEQVNFKLYLYDDFLGKKTSRPVTISDLKVVAPRIDNNGREYLCKEDGSPCPVNDPRHPNQNIAASIDVSFNELTGKWDSGTPQVIGRLTTDIAAASGVTLEKLIGNEIIDLLDPFAGQGVNTGSAIPIRMQNANPMQWSPDYSEFEGDGPRTNTDKEHVRVYNVSERAWASGEMVILNKIDGVWHPTPFGSESTGTTAESIPTNGQWEFHTLSSTVETYFRNSAGEQFRYDEYEQAFHRAYYSSDPLIENVNKYSEAVVANVDVDDGFVQFTSWDYLGANVGGLRAKHGIATTLFEVDANGNPLGENGDGKRVQGVHSSHFFGCVFPDGYDTGDKYAEYMKSPHTKIHGWGINPSHFLQTINSTQLLFSDTASDSVADTNALSMFTGDIKVRHLPADIATNAGPNGVNGRPLRDIRKLPLASASLSTFVSNNLANLGGYIWAYREDDNLDAFDFKPSNPSKVQFRPLKVEAYASFEHRSRAEVNAANAARPGFRNNPFNHGDGEFGAKCWEWINTDDPPVHAYVTGRTQVIGRNSIAWESPGLPITGTNFTTIGGLRYSRDIPAGHPISGDSLRSANVKFPSPYWGRWSDDRPAGVVGIIGAVSTATATSSIRFNADCYLGMQSWFSAGDFYPSWGGDGGNGPHNMNTSMLYARVYHRWPRNLTVYDPRFFAIHHFNEGFDQMGTTEMLSVDTLTPRLNAFTEMSVGDSVDSTTDMLTKENWQKNTQRRGKLLPYAYEYNTIGINNYNILAAGDGYTNGDTFTASGGQGTEVTLVATVTGGGPGPVDGFTFDKYDDIGHGFDGADFEGENVRIIPLSVTGTGFSGYVIDGIVYVRSGEDTKPEIATSNELLQLTPNPPLDNDGKIINELDELRSVDARLSNKSDDDQYDIFYHFHNDISHTFGNSFTAPPNAYEQAVTLEVVPL